MSVVLHLPVKIKCDMCESLLDASYDLVMDGSDLVYWKAKTQRKIVQNALEQAEEEGWLVSLGATLCPVCTKKVAEGHQEEIFGTKGVLGMFDKLLLSGRVVKAAQRKVGNNE